MLNRFAFFSLVFFPDFFFFKSISGPLVNGSDRGSYSLASLCTALTMPVPVIVASDSQLPPSGPRALSSCLFHL